ncbi:MAG: hypothetical protein LBU10_00290 [Endomicrobium sp.]|jgi:hypothetical protein|nr:hypothetical protein [Endomicrobium sp.]
MKKVVLYMTAFVVLSGGAGCSVYHTRMKVDIVSSPDATSQILRNKPLVASAKTATFFEKEKIDNLKKMPGKLKGSYYKIADNNRESIYVYGNTLNNFFDKFNTIQANKIYVDVQALCQSEGQTERTMFSSGTTPITTDANVNDEKRIAVLKGLLEEELVSKDFKIAKNQESAKYKLKVLIVEDGVSAKTTMSILYSLSRKVGVVGLDIKLLDNETGDTLLAYRTKNSSFLQRTNVLYCIPTHQSSLHLNMEY